MFLDEFGANTKMQRTHGRAAPGERVVAGVPHAHYKTLSTIAALSAAKGIVAAASYDGGTTAARFVDFVRDELVPVLRKGRVVVMDNLAWCCQGCNAKKGPNLSGWLKETGEVVPLFNPRQDNWDDHFAWDGLKIVGLTAIGRATAWLLEMNAEERIRWRAALRTHGLL